ncbi:MAG: hypothetical protein MZV70_58860 [Desulfobacterales bacterium]|nr:hypothetical protein [Desulfobacterales bacterium]
MGAGVIIAIDVGKSLPEREMSLGSALLHPGPDARHHEDSQNVTAQINSLGPADAFIRPELGDDIEIRDFKRGAEAARFGEGGGAQEAGRSEEALRVTLRIRGISWPVINRDNRPVRQGGIRQGGEGTHKRYRSEYVENKVGIKPGDVVTVERPKAVTEGLLYGAGDFERSRPEARKSRGCVPWT